jgi:hypothetical protein
MKLLNSMTGYAYQQQRWQVNELKGLRQAIARKDWESAKRRGIALAATNMVLAPVLGYLSMQVKSNLKGQGAAGNKLDDEMPEWRNAMEILSNQPVDPQSSEWAPAIAYLQAVNAGQSFGYFGSLLERGSRASQITREPYQRDIYKGIAGATGPVLQPGIDTGVLAVKWGNYFMDKAEGTASEKDREKLMKDTILWASTMAPNTLGIASAVGRDMTESEEKPSERPGWSGLSDTDADYTWDRGVSSPRRRASGLKARDLARKRLQTRRKNAAKPASRATLPPSTSDWRGR